MDCAGRIHYALQAGLQGAGTLARMGRTFTHRLRVRYGECDPQGVVFNANYLMYFDVALTELWREAIGPYSDMVEAGTDMVVAEARARFVAPARFDDVIDVAPRITHLGNTSMAMTLDILRDGELLVSGEMRYVFIDVATKQKTAIPDDVRRALEPYVVGPEAEAAA